MRKSLIVTLALSLTLALAGCGKAANDGADVKGEGVMTYADYVAADVDSEVVVETYVQAKQGWWRSNLLHPGQRRRLLPLQHALFQRGL